MSINALKMKVILIEFDISPMRKKCIASTAKQTHYSALYLIKYEVYLK